MKTRLKEIVYLSIASPEEVQKKMDKALGRDINLLEAE